MDFYTNGASLTYNNQDVMIKGVNWFGFETDLYCVHGLWQVSFALLLSFIKKNNFNAIRVPISLELTYNLDNYKVRSINTAVNPGMDQWTSGKMLDYLVSESKKQNILIMLDMHRLTANGPITPLWYDNTYSEQKVIDGWKILVSRYKNYNNVFAADLKNEPHDSASWGTGNLATDWNSAAERIGNEILKINPKLLIFVEGVQNYKGQNSWWGGNVAGALDKPVILSVPNKLVYSPHVYGPSVFNQNYFSDPNFPNNMYPIWDNDFGVVAKNNIAPVIIGEFGGWMNSENKDDIWQQKIGDYILANKLSFFYWCLPGTSVDTGGLLENDWVTPVQKKLDLLNRIAPNPTIFDLSSGGSTISPPPPSPSPSPSPIYPYPVPVSPSPSPISPSPLPKPPSPSHLIPNGSGITVSLTLVNKWTSNNINFYQQKIIITNKNNYPLKNIYITVTFDNMDNSWNSILTNNIFSFPSWLVNNGGLSPNQSFNFGFIVSGKQPTLVNFNT